MSAYELFVRERGWRVERVLVISPFVERTFFDELLDRLRPRHLHVIIDDSCRDRDVKLIEDAVADAAKGKRWPRLYLRQAAAPGLVHAKLFCVVERSVTGRIRRKIVYGSGNATQQAFSGTFNAELIATCRLSEAHHGEAIDWFESVRTATESPVSVDIAPINHVRLGKQITIQLPAFRVANYGPKIGTFDLWVQRGRLLSIYRSEPSFLVVQIVLKRPLPVEELTRRTEQAGFRAPHQRRLSYPYFAEARAAVEADASAEGAANDSDGGHWRRRYFTWTQLGDWCSEFCFRELQEMFVRKGHEKREAAVNALLELHVKSKRQGVRDNFVAAIEDLWSRYGHNASVYLMGDRKGPDKAWYLGELEKRISRDLAWAQDEEFSNRYVRGYELTEVPRFRSDESGWEEFLLSFCRQLIFDGLKSRQNAWLRRTFYDVWSSMDTNLDKFETAKGLLDMLRLHWRSRAGSTDTQTLGEYLSHYHSYWD